jgi:hypothetical protein
MVGCELTPGEISSETRASPPEGELAVLPIHIETGAGQLTVTVSSPVKEIATLGRRMLGEDNPDNKEQELNTDVFDAIGEILNLMSGGVDQALRSELSVGGSPGTWWRTDEPGEQSFEDGEFMLVETTLAAPEGTPVRLYLRMPLQLLEQTVGDGLQKNKLGRFGLVALPDELKGSIESALKEAGGETFELELEDPYFLTRCSKATALIVGQEPGFDVCRRVRLANETWSIPTILCLTEPTRQNVLDALDQGASHVLSVPFGQAVELLKVISAVRTA